MPCVHRTYTFFLHPLKGMRREAQRASQIDAGCAVHLFVVQCFFLLPLNTRIRCQYYTVNCNANTLPVICDADGAV